MKIIILPYCILLSLSVHSQIGGIRSESIFIADPNLEAAIHWEFEGVTYAIGYSNLPIEKFDFAVWTNNAGGYHAWARAMQVFKKVNEENWLPASTHFFESIEFGVSGIEYGTTNVKHGGSGFVKDLGNGYILISQSVHVKTLSVSQRFPVFLILQRNRNERHFDWDVKLEYLSNTINGNTVKSVKEKSDVKGTFDIIMSDEHLVRLYFNRSDYPVWMEDSKGYYKGSFSSN